MNKELIDELLLVAREYFGIDGRAYEVLNGEPCIAVWDTAVEWMAPRRIAYVWDGRIVRA